MLQLKKGIKNKDAPTKKGRCEYGWYEQSAANQEQARDILNHKNSRGRVGSPRIGSDGGPTLVSSVNHPTGKSLLVHLFKL